MKKCLLILSLLALTTLGHAQSTIDTVLAKITANNKSIQAQKQYWEAQKRAFQTGLTLPNPQVTYDFLIGAPGRQNELSVTQAFDYPKAYAKKRELADKQSAQAEYQLNTARKSILLEAKIACINLVYYTKIQGQLTERKQNVEKIISNFQTRLNLGDGNILDVNKARLKLLEINNKQQQNTSDIQQLNQQLTALNGGNLLTFDDKNYPKIPVIPTFEAFMEQNKAADPVLENLQQQKAITQAQVEVSKALSLPKFEAGYRYEGILGRAFQGVHLGMTIPLWENRNVVESQEERVIYADLNLEEHQNDHFYDIKRRYDRYESLKALMEAYQTIFPTLNNTKLLDKSLALGHFTTIEYFMELSYFYDAMDEYLEVEREFYEVIGEMYRFEL